MEPELDALFERLVEHNVIEVDSTGELVSINSTFERRRHDCRNALESDDGSVQSALEDALGRPIPKDDRLDQYDTGTGADAVAVAEVVPDLTLDEALSVAIALGQFDTPQDGVPNGFVPLQGAEIEHFLAQHPASVLYFWRRDCDPCDLVKSDLEELVAGDEIPEDVGLGAVFGPEYAQKIQEEYDVEVAPTLLFCVGTRVDSRFFDAHPVNAIRSEIEIIKSKSNTE